MAITQDILRSYRHPRKVMRQLLQKGQREDRVLVFLMVACFLIFVSTLPKLARDAHLDQSATSVPLDARIGGALLGWMCIAPLFFYVMSGVSHFLARLLGGKGSWYSARLALFWSLLVVAPVWLFYGLVAGFVGAGAAQNAVGLIVALCFAYLWGASLREAETAPES